MALSAGKSTSRLRGRRNECQHLDRLLTQVRGGRSAVAVVRGEPGVGKTALLEYLAERAQGFRLERASGVESEAELAYAGLHQLCAPMMDAVERIPAPQRDALRTAFGLAAGEPPDRFLVGLAVLSLLSEVADREPVLCIVDDAQWLDRVSAQTLAFVARRLLAEPVALVFAIRDPYEEPEFAGFEPLVVRGLNDRDARALLKAAVEGPLDEGVRDRIVAETRGNPLALLALPRGRTPAELAGGFGVVDVTSVASRVEEDYLQRVAGLPESTQLLLLTAAAEPVGDQNLLWRAAKRLGIEPSASEAAEAAGLIEAGGDIRFRHPLARSAAYRSGSAEERREAHRALADESDPDVDPDRRAWHRAKASAGPDEDVAGDLERAAGRAQARGGLAAAAAFLERAAQLTPDPGRRAQRALAAAEVKVHAGAPHAALTLLGMADAGPLNELERIKVDVMRGQLTFMSSHGSDAPPLLLDAAKRLEGIDVALARDTYLEALVAARFAGRFAPGGGLKETARVVRGAPAPLDTPGAKDLLLDGMAMRFSDGYAAGTPMLNRAMQAFRSPDLPVADALRWIWFACMVSLEMWDDEAWESLASRHLQLVRQTGALAILPIALSNRAAVHVTAGELHQAAALMEEAEAVAQAIGSRLGPYAALTMAATRGREAETLALVDATLHQVDSEGQGIGVNLAYWAQALLYNGLGRYERALAAAQQANDYPEHFWAMAELVEAGSRAGNASTARDALERLSLITQSAGTDWALGFEARARAVVSTGDIAEDLYREAIERLGKTRARLDLARAHLLYGEWLRRENRRVDARAQLRTAFESLSAMGVEGFAGRARRELTATGETVRKRATDTIDQLTTQEAQIGRLAAEGRTNVEIASELFLSNRTVEWHLRKVYAKLGVGSRKDLAGALPPDGVASVPAA